jgi:hypothetical protein
MTGQIPVNTGVAAMVRKTTVVRSFFMSSFSLLTLLEAHHCIPSFVHRVSYKVNAWVRQAVIQHQHSAIVPRVYVNL